MTTDHEPVPDESTGAPAAVPVLAVVGRPNVGKSTLVNRMIGRREAVVQDVPGVTRDRISYDATWNGRAFTVVDTGGWDPDARGLAERIRAQAEVAVTIADAVLFVVDATIGITDADEAVVKVLRKSGKPVILAANKVDDQRTEAEAAGLWNLGLGEPYPVSALHGRGSGDMLDAILAALPEPPPESYGEVGGPRRVAIVGRPNVGKSSLLNKLAKEDRAVVDDAAGTTVDPVDELIQLGGRTWRFIDTAGVRKRVKEASGHEYYASLRTNTAIERAEVCVMVVDGSQPISEQDLRIITAVAEAGRALVIAFNKWDLVDAPLLPRPRGRAGPGARAVGAAGQHHRAHRLARRPAGARPGRRPRGLVDPGRHRCPELLPGPAGLRAPAPGPRRQAAEDPVRHPGLDRAADVRAVHQRPARGVLPSVRRAAAA
jgi:GTP-binding protein